MPPTNIEGIEGGKYQAFGNLGLSFGNRQYLVAGDTCVEMRRTFNLATPCFLSSCKDGFKVIFQTRSSRFAASLLLTCTGLSQMVAPRGPRVKFLSMPPDLKWMNAALSHPICYMSPIYTVKIVGIPNIHNWFSSSELLDEIPTGWHYFDTPWTRRNTMVLHECRTLMAQKARPWKIPTEYISQTLLLLSKNMAIDVDIGTPLW